MVKLIDLTHSIDPSHVQRKFSVETIGAETVNHNVIRKDKQWYIMSNIAMVSHIGTHIEVPYHLFPNGYDLSNMPIDTYYGKGVLLNFSEIQQRTESRWYSPRRYCSLQSWICESLWAKKLF